MAHTNITSPTAAAMRAKRLIVQALETVSEPNPQLLSEAHEQLVYGIRGASLCKDPEAAESLSLAISRLGGAMRLCGRDNNVADHEARLAVSLLIAAGA